MNQAFSKLNSAAVLERGIDVLLVVKNTSVATASEIQLQVMPQVTKRAVQRYLKNLVQMGLLYAKHSEGLENRYYLMNKGDRVKVDFVSESATIYSGKRFTGYGVLDRVEDGRVFGRLDDGTPFSCFTADVEIIPLVDRTEEFEAFFTAQPFFKNLRFIHGDKLFDFDKGIGYRNLTVQVGYVCFCKGDGEFVLND